MDRQARGFMLIVSLLVATGLIALTSVAMTRAATEHSAARRSLGQRQAFAIAEAGLDRALTVLETSSLDWNDELVGADGIVGTADDGLLDFGAVASLTPEGAYAVRVFDNADELAPTPDDPLADADGVIRVESAGTLGAHRRTAAVWLRAMFNHAIAAQMNILLRQASAMGHIHANGDIEVRQTSQLVGCSQATASGTFIIPAGEELTHTCGDLVGGDPLLTFLQPDVAALRLAVTRWDAANWRGAISLLDGDVAGYDRPLDSPPDTPQTVSLGGTATLVIFSGHSIRFRQQMGTFNGSGACVTPLNLSVLAVEGAGSIAFDQRVCLRGLIWAGGDITVSQGSVIAGALVSGGSIDVKQGSVITFDRSAIAASLLPGFSGATELLWQDW